MSLSINQNHEIYRALESADAYSNSINNEKRIVKDPKEEENQTMEIDRIDAQPMEIDRIGEQPMEIDRIGAQPKVYSIGQWSELPMDVARIIFQKIKADFPALALVCKSWRDIIDDKDFRKIIRPPEAFGTQEWKEYIGVDPGEEPLLPRRVYSDWTKEEKNYLLTLIPQKVKVIETGEDIILDNLKVIGELTENPKKGHKIGFQGSGDKFNQLISRSRLHESPHWVWIKKEEIRASECMELIKKEKKKIPGLIDTTISIFMEFVRSGECTFKKYSSNTITSLRVEDDESRNWGQLVLSFYPPGCSYFIPTPAGLGIDQRKYNDDIAVVLSWSTPRS